MQSQKYLFTTKGSYPGTMKMAHSPSSGCFLDLSYRRRPVSIPSRPWMPSYAGMTKPLCHFVAQIVPVLKAIEDVTKRTKGWRNNRSELRDLLRKYLSVADPRVEPAPVSVIPAKAGMTDKVCAAVGEKSHILMVCGRAYAHEHFVVNNLFRMEDNRSMHLKRVSLGCLTAALLLILPCPSAYSAAVPTRLVIGYASTTPRLMPLWMAREQGFFAKYGIESEPVLLRNGAYLVTGMASGDIQIGRTAGAAVLSAVAAGHDIKMLATFSSHNSYDVVVRPNIKRAEDIRGKKLAINSFGGGTWIGAMLWLEQFGLDLQRDQIILQSVGDQGVQSQALEAGTVDVAFLDSVYSKLLKQRGMTILAESGEMKQPLVS